MEGEVSRRIGEVSSLGALLLVWRYGVCLCCGFGRWCMWGGLLVGIRARLTATTGLCELAPRWRGWGVGDLVCVKVEGWGVRSTVAVLRLLLRRRPAGLGWLGGLDGSCQMVTCDSLQSALSNEDYLCAHAYRATRENARHVKKRSVDTFVDYRKCSKYALTPLAAQLMSIMQPEESSCVTSRKLFYLSLGLKMGGTACWQTTRLVIDIFYVYAFHRKSLDFPRNAPGQKVLQDLH
ncbi:hypothetical protein Tco_0534522 [Tanacetum coccineum]